MTYVTIRELRNHGGEVLDRAAAGETELRPIAKPPMTAARLVALFMDLPATDPARFRADIDAGLDQSI